MILRCVCALIAVLLINSLVSAQPPQAPAPWPPAPNDIFAEGIAWALVGEGALSTEIPTMSPDTMPHETQTMICRNQIQQVSSEGLWIVIEQDYNDLFLCQTATGEERKPSEVALTWNSLIENIDETHVLLVDNQESDLGFRPQIVLYDVSTDTAIPLGMLPGWIEWDYHTSVCDWFTPTSGLICMDNTAFDFMPTNYYAFDLTQSDSLEPVFYGWDSTIFKLDDPRRYVVIESDNYTAYETGSGTWEDPCQVIAYSEAGLRMYPLGGGCIPVSWGIGVDGVTAAYTVGNAFYYLATDQKSLFSPENPTSSTLHRFDVETETISKPLLTGELEMLLGISPDERYIALATDDNNEIDFHWIPDEYTAKKWPVIVLDTQSGEIVYQSEPLELYGAWDVQWVDDDSLVIFSSEMWRIDFAGNEVTVYHTDQYRRHYPYDDVCLSDSRDFALAIQQDGGPVLVDLATSEAIPLFRSEALEGYLVDMECDSDGSLTVSVRSNGSVRTYRVTLPQ